MAKRQHAALRSRQVAADYMHEFQQLFDGHFEHPQLK
jgi:hypothetical protein